MRGWKILHWQGGRIPFLGHALLENLALNAGDKLYLRGHISFFGKRYTSSSRLAYTRLKTQSR